ncbi:MAG: OsmC family peroxiredoxin [Flavobacteriales bacterium]|nr:MAG: OsmC family peroxiredoxin [Flavobacteriales bacterium]
MISKVQYLGSLRTESTHLASGEKVITDAPIDNHGRGEAFSPTDMLANHLATCMITVMGIYAENTGFSMEGTTASVHKVMASNPRRVAAVEIDLQLPAGIPEKYRSKLEDIGLNCPVAKSLHPDLVQQVRIKYV